MFSDTSIYLKNYDLPELEKIIHDWSNQYPDGGIFALVAERNVNDVKNLQLASSNYSYPLAGAVFPELIVNSKLNNQGLLLFLLKTMPSHHIIPITEPRDKQDDYGISQFINIDNNYDEHALFIIFDAMIPNISTIIDNLYLKIGDSVNYMGVNAGSETFQPINCLFDNKQFTGNAVLTLLIENHTGAIVEHGYTSPDTSISATATAGNHISSIDWKPAFEVYQELAKSYYGVDINKDNFYENAVHFPFGIMRMDGEMLVRIPVSLEDDGSIFCVGEVPENSILTLLKAVSPNSSTTVDKIACHILENENADIMSFYCAGRRMHLGDAALAEIQLLSEKLGNKNIVGALSLGEIGGSKQGGYPLFHNAALVNIPWE